MGLLYLDEIKNVLLLTHLMTLYQTLQKLNTMLRWIKVSPLNQSPRCVTLLTLVWRRSDTFCKAPKPSPCLSMLANSGEENVTY